MAKCVLSFVDLTPEGYSRIRVGRPTKVLAHRWAYEVAFGPIPEGLVIDHLCRVRNCVEPSHLEAVTVAENNRRMHAARTPIAACKRAGHPYDELNTSWSTGGRGRPFRVCLACVRDRYHGKKELVVVGGSHR